MHASEAAVRPGQRHNHLASGHLASVVILQMVILPVAILAVVILPVVNEVDVDGDRSARLVVKLPWKPPWKERTESCGVPGVSFVCNIFVRLEIWNQSDP